MLSSRDDYHGTISLSSTSDYIVNSINECANSFEIQILIETAQNVFLKNVSNTSIK